ncbi:hypothetical protein [Haloarcula sp. CBA1131]|uniref:hypothetical protein n=1 Tax=Haloarcula sp. CBA1131 TaxID=1853686 RepID=UPI0012479ABB|nr:hypothetical protein [Haloarcula sp. CBA1131]
MKNPISRREALRSGAILSVTGFAGAVNAAPSSDNGSQGRKELEAESETPKTENDIILKNHSADTTTLTLEFSRGEDGSGNTEYSVEEQLTSGQDPSSDKSWKAEETNIPLKRGRYFVEASDDDGNSDSMYLKLAGKENRGYIKITCRKKFNSLHVWITEY